ncbi:MAG TPA: PAS domain-containing protein [bacterium]
MRAMEPGETSTAAAAAREAYVQAELERVFREWTIRAAFSGALLFLLVAPLDFISAPELAPRFFAYRLAAAAGLLLLRQVAARTTAPAVLRVSLLSAVALSAVTIEVMILLHGGHHSPYLSGMILIAIVALGFIPASTRFQMLVAGVIYVVFLVPLLLWGGPTGPRQFFTQNYLLVAILAVMVAMRHLHRISLVREFGLAYDIAAKERHLENQVAERTDELVRAAAQWRATFDSVGDAILMLDGEGLVVRANRAAASLARLEHRQVPGTGIAKLLQGARLAGALAPLEAQQRTGLRVSAEIAHALTDRWFLATAEPVHPDLEQAGGTVLTLRDITDVKVMERALRESRDDWQETFDSIREGITIHDADFRVVRSNAAARRLLGLGERPLAPRPCFELFHGLAEPIGGCPGRETLRTRQPTTVDLDEPHLGRYLEITALPRRGGGITHVVHDVSERKLAMDELNHAAARLQRILGRAPFGVFIVDDDLRVEFANPAMVAISGYARDEFVGAYLHGFPGFLEPGIATEVQGAIEGVPFAVGPAGYRSRDGRLVVGRFTGIPIEEEGRRKALVFVEDVTSLSQAEQERHRLQALLLQAQKMQSIGTLASGIAHDFNNILLAVIGLTDAASEQLAEGHPARRQLDDVIGAAERGSDLVHQILAFGRRQELRMRPVEPSRLVAEIRGMLAHVLPKTIAIGCRTDEEPPPVVADSAQIGQVLLNLAINARDAMPGGGTLSFVTGAAVVEADAPAHPGVPPGRYAVISVRDTGVGMEPDLVPRIFDPFFTTKEPGQGTGLGLATAYGIVSQHGGALRVESAPGAGSTFFVYLPAAPGAQPADASPVPGGTEAILLVGDDATARRAIGGRLADLGYRVRFAAGGEEALLLLEADGFRPDLLLCDGALRSVGVRQVAAAARARVPGLRVVFLSSHPASQLMQSGLAAPGDLLLPRDLGTEEIARRLREVLGGGVLR